VQTPLASLAVELEFPHLVGVLIKRILGRGRRMNEEVRKYGRVDFETSIQLMISEPYLKKPIWKMPV
jgi:hypothetical protein